MDFTQIQNSRVDSIETINLSGSADYTVRLNKSDVLDMNNNDNRMFVYGGAGDTVEMSGSGWSFVDNSTSGGYTWNKYSNGLATLMIEQDITALLV